MNELDIDSEDVFLVRLEVGIVSKWSGAQVAGNDVLIGFTVLLVVNCSTIDGATYL